MPWLLGCILNFSVTIPNQPQKILVNLTEPAKNIKPKINLDLIYFYLIFSFNKQIEIWINWNWCQNDLHKNMLISYFIHTNILRKDGYYIFSPKWQNLIDPFNGLYSLETLTCKCIKRSIFLLKLVTLQTFLKSQNFLLSIELYPIAEFQDRIMYGLAKLMHNLNKFCLPRI